MRFRLILQDRQDNEQFLYDCERLLVVIAGDPRPEPESGPEQQTLDLVVLMRELDHDAVLVMLASLLMDMHRQGGPPPHMTCIQLMGTVANMTRFVETDNVPTTPTRRDDDEIPFRRGGTGQ